MQRRRKQLLGLAGLAGVAIMTAVACLIPAPDAAAKDVDVRVQVNNAGTKPDVRFVSLNDGDTEVQQKFTVKIGYTRATKLKLFLKNEGELAAPSARAGADPEAGEIPVDLTGSSCENITYSDVEAYCEVQYDLGAALPGQYGTQFSSRAYVDNGTTGQSNEDGVVFFYRTVLLQYAEEHDKDGNPVVVVRLHEGVKKGLLQVYDADGKAMFAEPIDVLIAGTAQADGSYKLSLPLKAVNAATGKYTATLVGLGQGPDDPDELTTIGISTVTGIDYTVGGGPRPPVDPDDPDKPVDPDNPDNPDKPTNPDNPETPDTGLNLFRDLNISRADYIITGLIAFGIVTGFAIFLILRRNKR